MENSFEMDFEEWELLPGTHHSFIDFGLEREKDYLFFDANYFSNEKRLISEEKEQQVARDDIVKVSPSPTLPTVVFKKMIKDDEFVGMKVESTKSYSTMSITAPPIEPEKVLFSSEDEYEEDELYKHGRRLEKEIESVEPTKKEKQNWKWKVIRGAVALCSLCIFILGGRQVQKHHHQKIQLQMYTNEKRIKQVVQHATRLNQAFSVMRGAPMTRAHVSFGGYYDGI